MHWNTHLFFSKMKKHHEITAHAIFSHQSLLPQIESLKGNKQKRSHGSGISTTANLAELKEASGFLYKCFPCPQRLGME